MNDKNAHIASAGRPSDGRRSDGDVSMSESSRHADGEDTNGYRVCLPSLGDSCGDCHRCRPSDGEDANREACKVCGDVHRGDGKPQRNCCDWSSADHMCACCKADAFPASPMVAPSATDEDGA